MDDRNGDIIDRILELMNERGWTAYKLTKESGLAPSTINNIISRNANMRLDTLEAICRTFGITMSQFFADGNLVELGEEQAEMFHRWKFLTVDEKALVNDQIRIFTKGRKKKPRK